MKRINLYQLVATFFLLASYLSNAVSLSAQPIATPTLGEACRFGLEYQVFRSGSPATSFPIVLTIEPLSPAAEAGIQVGDYIVSINGQSTASLDAIAIDALLRNTSSGETLVLKVANFRDPQGKELALRPDCIARSALDESMLADAFAFYSLRDASVRRVVYPFVTTSSLAIDFNKLRYFALSSVASSSTSSEDQAIVSTIKQLMNKKGLIESTSEAKYVLDFYYTIAKNPRFNEQKSTKIAKESSLHAYRVDFQSGRLAPYPLLEVGGDRELAPYILTFGLNVYDATLEKILWSTEAVEYTTEQMAPSDYAKLALPVMLMQFPAVRYENNLALRVVEKRYYYTGISYDSSNIALIASVDSGSPAEKVGLKAGDVVISINGKEVHSADEHSKAYRSFVKRSLRYRNPETNFVDRNGVANCRFWDSNDYAQITKLFKQKKYKTAFAYLFDFRPFVSGIEGGNTHITMDVVRNGMPHSFIIEPIQLDKGYISLD